MSNFSVKNGILFYTTEERTFDFITSLKSISFIESDKMTDSEGLFEVTIYINDVTHQDMYLSLNEKELLIQEWILVHEIQS